MPLASKTYLGPYEILASLGAGGMGEVYRARDSRLGRDVALKVIPRESSRDSERIRRFEQEARAAGTLSHPNVCAAVRIAMTIACALILGTAPVAPRAAGAPGAAGTDTIDSLLARAIVTQLDAWAAIEGTSTQLYTKGKGYALGVPSYLDASAKGISAEIERLNAAHSDDANREGVRRRLLERLENLGKAVDLAIQAIRAARQSGGWTSGANDLLSRFWASYRAGPPVDSLEIGVLSGSTTIRNALSRDALLFAGIAQDSSGYRLGVVAWVTAPMRLASVAKDSRAERLGLQGGDEIVSVDGRTFETMTELRWHLAAQAGKKIDIVVERDGSCIALHPKAPDGVASYAEVHRELEQQYHKLTEAYGLQDDKAIASMYTADFHTIFPNGQIMDAREAEAFYGKSTEKVGPVEARYTIRSVTVSENRLIAVVEVFQEFKWMRKQAGGLRTARSSQMMRQIWSRTGKGWKIKSTDNIREKR